LSASRCVPRTYNQLTATAWRKMRSRRRHLLLSSRDSH
jgi:hypothetical protein